MNRVVQSSEMLGLPKLKFTRQQTHNALASQGSRQQCQAQISYEKDGLSMPKIIQQQPGLKPTKPASIRLRGISLGKLTEGPSHLPRPSSKLSRCAAPGQFTIRTIEVEAKPKLSAGPGLPCADTTGGLPPK